MDTSKLKKFAQFARRTLIAQVSAKMESVIAEGAAARREHPEAMKKLEAAIARDGKGQVIDRVAYIWFNRFSALRFMDVNELNPVRVVSPLVGQFQPEIIAEAKAGNINEDRVPDKVRAHIRALLDGRTPSPDAQAEAYRLLIVAICNDWHRVMPFLFERIDDFTELLLPEDLLSNNSILAYTREAMTPDVCEDVEVIGWLYQFYISEKKDEVFAGLKKNVKITAENIPAATQLFTPHWIVRYLVENSLGRLWMLNRPASKLAAKMDYYIAPEEPEEDFLRISSPEEIKVCDPACGSGHMLTYAFDLLNAIYEEEGYNPAEIPKKILTHNLYGIEIDERAGALAAFALVMKAAGRGKRFLRRAGKEAVQPKICVLENISFTDGELADYMKEVGRDLFTDDLRETLGQFDQAKNFGSLIVPKLRDVAEVRRVIAGKDFAGDMLYGDVHARVQSVLRMADYLSSKYHVVVANPPYMGASNANSTLKSWLSRTYPNSKRDLFSAFIERNISLSKVNGMVAMITMQNWMFITRYQSFRDALFEVAHFKSMAHLGERGFDTIGGEVVSTTAFVLMAGANTEFRARFVRLTDGHSEAEKAAALREAAAGLGEDYCHFASISEFKRIPGDPLAYWVSPEFRNIFASRPDFNSVLEAREGLTTGRNEDYVRFSFEVSRSKVCRDAKDRAEASRSSAKWFPYNKGGEKRRWFGNDEFVVNWENDGELLQTRKHPSDDRIWAHNFNLDFIFRPSISWSDITTKGLSARLFPSGFIFDATGLSAFNRSENDFRFVAASICNSKAGTYIAEVLNPTMHFKAGDFAEVPLVSESQELASENCQNAISISRSDWDAYETSWDFTTLPLLDSAHREPSLDQTYAHLRAQWRGMTEEMQRLEQENNRIFIDAYGLQDELTPEVLLEEITLTCNPANRYGDKLETELEDNLRADTTREFVSYAVGCMFGRYSLDAPGLILANQGDGMAEYLARVPNSTFAPDADNVIPILDGDWFPDDITERFRKFLRVTFGEACFQENLTFVEDSLGRPLRSYFTRDFYADHVKRYKKRPIYWLFSSPKGTFNALIYMHRYRPDTVSVVLNEYLREFRSKLEAYRRSQEALSISGEASPAQKTKALKEIEATTRQIEEIDGWERDILFPLATQKIEIDLDDGVKANYPKLGAALKPIKGLNDSDD